MTEGLLKRALGIPSLVLFGLVHMVPLTAFTASGIVAQATGGRVALTSVITLLAMVVIARQSFGGATGFLVGWSLLLDSRPLLAPKSGAPDRVFA